MPGPTNITIGSRRSRLARIQAHQVARRITNMTGIPTDRFTFVSMTSDGDRFKEQSLAKIGGKGLFTRKLDQAVLDGHIDIAVHSLKDLPCQKPPDGLTIAAYLPRTDPRDVLIAPVARIEDLPIAAKLGGASVRRTAQARAIRPDLHAVLIRGNVQTRLDRFDSGHADAMILSACGLQRLGLLDPNWTLLPITTLPPAPGQGIVVAVTRCDARTHVNKAMTAINDGKAHLAAEMERSFSLHLGGSCNVPLAAHCTLASNRNAHLLGEILSEDGQNRYRDEITCPTPSSAADAAEHGRQLALRIRIRMKQSS